MISIIIPVFNKQKELEQCIESILKQTYKDYEINLIDDGSQDESKKICDNYANKYSNINVYHIENKGVSNARNVGIEHSNGEYIIFIDADDIIKENYLNKLTKNIENYNLIMCGFTLDIQFKNRKVEKIYDKTKEESIVDKQEILDLSIKEILNPVWNKIYKKSIIEENNIKFDTSISLGEDLKFNLEYINKMDGKMLIINDSLYHYYLKSIGLNIKNLEDMEFKINRIYKTYEQFIELYESNGLEIDNRLYSYYLYKICERFREYMRDSNDSAEKKAETINKILKSDQVIGLIEKPDKNLIVRLAKRFLKLGGVYIKLSWILLKLKYIN